MLRSSSAMFTYGWEHLWVLLVTNPDEWIWIAMLMLIFIFIIIQHHARGIPRLLWHRIRPLHLLLNARQIDAPNVALISEHWLISNSIVPSLTTSTSFCLLRLQGLLGFNLSEFLLKFFWEFIHHIHVVIKFICVLNQPTAQEALLDVGKSINEVEKETLLFNLNC